MSTIPPGWYKDPADPTTQRWWDGEGWLGDPIPADATPPDGPPAVSPPAPPPAAATAPSPRLPPPGLAVPGPTGPAGPPMPPGGAVPWPMSHRYPVAAPRPHGFLLAGAGARFMARLVDALAVLVLGAVANIWFAIEFWRSFKPVLAWATSRPASLDTAPASAQRAWEMMLWMGVVLTAVWFAYEVPASANTGQTLGKRIFGIRVVREESDERLGFGRSFRRWFRMAWPTPFWAACYGIPILLQIVDSLFVVMDRQLHQALHDRIARTLVVQVPRPGRSEVPPDPATSGHQPASSSSTPTGERHADPR
ncbi:MAG: RDD family protein [Candidatus Rokubacteria bacterium]|nr:RDD family protein [Candidatus Rokubacteria bacterium]